MKQWQVRHRIKSKSPSRRRQEIIEAILANRKIKNREEFFSPPPPSRVTAADVGISPRELTNAKKRLLLAKKRGEQVLIWGDYDTDGICGTAILWEALWKNGFDALPYIPLRSEGYGLSETTFFKLKKKHPKIGLVITVDNGIVAHKAVREIAKSGTDVIITDHHIKEEQVPKAAAIVWTTKMCGAAVAWFLAREFTASKNDGLGLAALATVADFMPLLSINRSLVKYGLRHLRRTERAGLLSMYREAGLIKENLEAYHLGFIIAPRLNAMGRLATAMDSLRLLCTNDRERAGRLAQKIGRANRERQAMTSRVFLKAVREIRRRGQENDKLLFVHSASFHPGVIGLVAGKLTEKFYRPAIVAHEDGVFTKASCRSIKGFNIVAAIRRLGRHLVTAGGHPQAAGFTVRTKDLARVEKELQAIAEGTIDEKILVAKVAIDCQLSFADLNFSLFEALERFKPFGFGNPRPVFKTANVRIEGIRRVGKDKSHLKLILDDLGTKKIERMPASPAGGPAYNLRQGAEQGVVSGEADEGSRLMWDGIGFGMGDLDLKIGDRIDIAYNLVVNEWNGRRNLELKIEEIRKR